MKEKINILISERNFALNQITETDSDSQAAKVCVNDNFVRELLELLNEQE